MTGQALEAAAIAAVENAPPADEAEVRTHGNEPDLGPSEHVAPEEAVEPEEPEPEDSAAEQS